VPADLAEHSRCDRENGAAEQGVAIAEPLTGKSLEELRLVEMLTTGVGALRGNEASWTAPRSCFPRSEPSNSFEKAIAQRQ
jgi:hypothetical protein